MKNFPILLLFIFMIFLVVITLLPTKADSKVEFHSNDTIDKQIVHNPTIKHRTPVWSIVKNEYNSPNYRNDIALLTEAMFHEDRAHEPAKVFMVIMNRVFHENWPNTVEEVIKQNKAFSYINDIPVSERRKRERYEAKKYKEIRKIANLMLSSSEWMDTTGGALYYYAHDKMDKPYWWDDKYFTMATATHSFASWHKIK